MFLQHKQIYENTNNNMTNSKRPRSRSATTSTTRRHQTHFLLVLVVISLSQWSQAFIIPSLSVSRPFFHDYPQLVKVLDPEKQKQQPQQEQEQEWKFLLPGQPAEAWARKYASVDALRKTFGGNKNSVWGDLDASSARLLYKSLLPKALLELHQYYSHQQGSSAATDLAPLAYQARVAAKLYARERSYWPYRLAASLYDGFRQYRKYGKFQTQGMSYEQVWEKYATALDVDSSSDCEEDVIAAKIGQKILERACATNPMVDQLCINKNSKRGSLTSQDLQRITEQLENDMQNLLFAPALHDEDAVEYIQNIPDETRSALTRYRRLRQLSKMKSGLGKLSSPFLKQ